MRTFFSWQISSIALNSATRFTSRIDTHMNEEPSTHIGDLAATSQ
jgi:hypothetical protein